MDQRIFRYLVGYQVCNTQRVGMFFSFTGSGGVLTFCSFEAKSRLTNQEVTLDRDSTFVTFKNRQESTMNREMM